MQTHPRRRTAAIALILEKGRISFEGPASVLHGSEELLSGLGVSARMAARAPVLDGGHA